MIPVGILGAARKASPPPEPGYEFPTITGTVFTPFNSNALDHMVSMPGNVAPGDVLLIAFMLDENRGLSTPPGWEVLESAVNPGLADEFILFYRVADGSEGGASVNLHTSTATRGLALCVRISGSAPSSMFEVERVINSGPLSVPTPSISPSWGLAKNLFITLGGMGRSNEVLSYPLPDNNMNSGERPDNPNYNISMSSAQAEVDFIDPGNQVYAASPYGNQWGVIFTVAVKPK